MKPLFSLVLTTVSLALVAGCGSTPAPQATMAKAQDAEAAAMQDALSRLPAAERDEASAAADITPPAPARDDELAPLRTMFMEAKTLLGFNPAFKDDSELVPYLTSLVRAKPVESYDPQGFLKSLGLDHPMSTGKTDAGTFAAVRVIKDYSPGHVIGGDEIHAQVLAWKIARNFPRTYVALAHTVNPALEAYGRLTKSWTKPFQVRQTAHPTGQSAADRYGAPAVKFSVLFDPDVHTGLPVNQHPGAHPYGTYPIALAMGFPDEAARRLGQICNGVDGDSDVHVPYPNTGPMPMQGIDRHFNLDRKHEDTRYVWAQRHLQAAIAFGKQTSWVEAETELGMGLHSLQDSFAHGQMTPYLHGTIGEFPDDLRFDPIAYLEAEQATRGYIRAYLDGVMGR